MQEKPPMRRISNLKPVSNTYNALWPHNRIFAEVYDPLFPATVR